MALCLTLLVAARSGTGRLSSPEDTARFVKVSY